MNLLLLRSAQLVSDTEAIADERQSEHINKILKLSAGDSVSLGLINGKLGRGKIARTGPKVFIDDICLDLAPPPCLPLTLILGMPRPQMLKRILQTVACMGVAKLCLIQSSRVEKSFWQSPSASDSAIEQQLILGLEQGVATQLPAVEKHLRFRPFMEDTLATLSENSLPIVAHPGGQHAPLAQTAATPITLAVGPEGGFLSKEVESFCARGFQTMDLGRRILKVETAIPVLLGKLYQTDFHAQDI